MGSIIVDKKLGLVWQDNSVAKGTKMKWKSAKKYCQNLKLTGYNDWRLPNYDELLTIVDYDRHDPAIMPSFQNIISHVYWSSTQKTSSTKSIWAIQFKEGRTITGSKINSNYIMCVHENK